MLSLDYKRWRGLIEGHFATGTRAPKNVFRFVCHQFIGTWGVAIAATLAVSISFGAENPVAPGTFNSGNTSWLRTNIQYFPAQMGIFASRYIPSLSGPTPLKSSSRESQSQSGGEVALTFDDLPAHGPLPPGLSRVDIAKRIIGALQDAHAPPTYGFVNAKGVEQDPSAMQVLRLWRDAGFPLGNHTFSHMDLNRNSAEAFEKDIIADEPILQELMGQDDWHWFRFPYLNEGNTAKKHRAILAFLTEHHYRVAEVSLDFGDDEYNEL